ncbi:hypothetical protein ACNJX9_20005 [Bradyrhizobium sp. DASA03076]|jgi:hypothetical protein|uniref:DUF1611 domain-containing protein n=1 Tax=Bradyrhizobium manausense TaxID=989370 RepID=A0A0R3D1P1_9BRAD|nr:hypothetical protein [Bradyrhizobium manausense]KRQ03555.1 hypothetical protein AOQ71_33240 [Bradyrhizobium manausense]
MAVLPGDVFLATPGHRESTRWVVGGVPKEGLIPGKEYSILSSCGIVGELIGSSSQRKSPLGKVEFLGRWGSNQANIRDFSAINDDEAGADKGAELYLIVGTSAEVGKTTAGLTILRSLLHQGYSKIAVLKATGTSSIVELMTYRDFGAFTTLDCVDFGLPTTYPSEREDIAPVFDRAIRYMLGLPAQAVLIECGGDILGANVPIFLERLKKARQVDKLVLVAPDSLAAFGGLRILEKMGFAADLLTGPCTDTPTLLARTEKLCGVKAMNMLGPRP